MAVSVTLNAAASRSQQDVGAVASPRPSTHPAVLRMTTSKNAAWRLVFRPGRAQTISLYRGRRLTWRGIPRRWHPFRVRIGNVVGDATPEVVIGVWKGSRFFPRPHTGLFIYRLVGTKLIPCWLGSSLGHPYTDFTLRPGPHGGLMSVVTNDGRAYRWDCFGLAPVRKT